MSLTNPGDRAKVTFAALEAKKHAGAPIAALTAYDYPSARIADEAGVDLLLVGDTLAAWWGWAMTRPCP